MRAVGGRSHAIGWLRPAQYDVTAFAPLHSPTRSVTTSQSPIFCHTSRTRALPVPCEILRKEIEDINRQGDEQTPEEIAQTVDIEAALRAEAAATPQEAMQVDNDYRMSDLSAVLALEEALKTKVLEIETTQLRLTHNLLNPNLLNPNLLNSNLLNPNLALPMNPNLALPMNPNLALPMNPNLAHPMNPNLALQVNPNLALQVNPNLALQVNPNLAPLQVQAPQVTL
ncbi:hypothetical protein Pmani_020204 [Petrolisthes manimaculis]|uniref:Uncharacterized protein n=1 Tax=Petrolisthes manimaculis TaxID=1843537 RepID=A0AAE1U2T4_9EUCA|nr:hypothetical protein Pmani_020204 [Petrolisthes manimaculis]